MRFSILIPSYNRADYLDKTLQSCINQSFSDVEFIVCDDASTDHTQTIVEKYITRDSRFRYFKQNLNVGLLDNFEHGINIARGDYILALGSDDALMPGCLNILNNAISKTKIELVTWPTAAFFYPNTMDDVGQLVIPNRNMTGKYTFIKSTDFLTRQAQELAYVADEDCPMIYVKAIASRTLIHKVKERNNGNFYASSTPDGFSGIVLAGETEKFLKIDKILTMHGVSPSSAGVNYISSNSDTNDLSDKFFLDAKKLPMHNALGSIEYSPLISLMTADFLFTARDLPGWAGNFGEIDFKNLIRRSLAEVQDGLMDEKKVSRELKLIKQLSEATDNTAYFNSVVNRLRRNRRSRLSGDAISPRLIYLSAKECDVHDVLEATFFVKFFVKLSFFSGFLRLLCMALNSAQYAVKRYLPGKSLSTYLDK